MQMATEPQMKPAENDSLMTRLGSLEDELMRLEEVLHNLEQKVDPILRPELSGSTDDASVRAASITSSASSKVDSHLEFISNLTSRIEELKNRVDL